MDLVGPLKYIIDPGSVLEAPAARSEVTRPITGNDFVDWKTLSTEQFSLKVPILMSTILIGSLVAHCSECTLTTLIDVRS